jgi:hypothetical protein
MEKAWLAIANKRYASEAAVKKEYQKVVEKSSKMAEIEQEWVDVNLSPLMEFMGDESVWMAVVPGVKVEGAHGRASSRGKPKTPYPLAVFSGAHWNSRKGGESVFFDPYDHYQIPGTNQFCQTFAMMYLADSLPLPLPDGLEKHYEYAVYALEFIKSVIINLNATAEAFNVTPGITRKTLLKKVNECLNYPNITVNAIELP